MAVHEVGGERIEVATLNRYFWFYRRQGVSVEVSPSRKWWCLWLCTSTKDIDQIRCSVVLTGPVGDDSASASCSDCGRLDVWGPAYWGGGVPPAYQGATYTGTVMIDGQTYGINGSLIYS